jgi:hypothetical protein
MMFRRKGLGRATAASGPMVLWERLPFDPEGSMAWAKSKRRRKRKAAPKPKQPQVKKTHRPAAAPGARKGRGENRLVQKIDDFFSWWDDQGYSWRDYFRMGLLLSGLLVILYYSFSAGGYFVVKRGYGELFILYLVVLGLLFGVSAGGRMPRLGYLELAFFGGYTLWILLSITWSYAPARSLDEFIRAILYLAGYGLFYLYLARRQWLEWLGHVFIIIVIIVALDAIFGKIGIIDHPDPFGTNRLSYPITYWNTLGLMMIMVFPLVLRVLAERATNLLLRCIYGPALVLFLAALFFTFSRAGVLVLALVFVLYLVTAVNRLRAVLQAGIGLFWTGIIVAVCYRFLPTMVKLIPNPDSGEGHRLGWWILIVVLLAAASQFALWFMEKGINVSREMARKFGYGLVAATLVLFMAGSVVFFARHDGPVNWVRSQLNTISEPEAVVEESQQRLLNLQSERYKEYAVSLSVFADHPLNGTGSGTWSIQWYRERPREIQVKDGHSWLFETMAELGIVGTILLLGFIGLFVARGIIDLRKLGRSRYREIYGAFFVSCIAFILHAFIDWDWEMAVITLSFFFFAGGLLRYGALSKIGGDEISLEETTGDDATGDGWNIRQLLSWHWLIGVLCVVMMVVTVFPLVSANRLDAASKLARDGRDPDALKRQASLAAIFNPLDGQPLAYEGLAYQALGNLDQAERLMLEAVDLEPYNDKFYRSLTQIYIQKGDADGAVAAIKRSRELNPLESKETGALEEKVRQMPGAVL